MSDHAENRTRLDHATSDRQASTAARRLRILMIGPASTSRVGGTTVSFKYLREAIEKVPGVALEVHNSMGVRGAGVLTPVLLVRFLLRLIPAARRNDVITIHAMPTGLPYIAWFLVLLAWFSGKPLLYRSFGGMYYAELWQPNRWLAGLLMHHADIVLLQTRQLMEFAQNDNIGRFEWFPTARPMPTTAPEHVGPCRRFVFVGQVKIRKGLEYLAKAAEQLPPDASIDVYGPWHDLPRDTFDHCDRIKYVRELRPDEVHDTLRQYDALVFPTFLPEEGYAGIVPESYAAALPIIATRWRALPEIIPDGEAGLLIEPHSEQQLADAMMRLYRDNELYLRLVRGTARMRDVFSVQRQAEHFLGLCRELVGSHEKAEAS